MDFDELVKDIDLAGEFHDRDHAISAAGAVLVEGGGELFDIDEFDRRVAEGERADVTAQLPRDYVDLRP